MGPKSILRLLRTLGPSLASLAQSSWSLLVMALVMGPLLGRIASIGIPSLDSVDNILYVEGLKCNLLSISKFCNSGYIVSFNKDQCIVKADNDKSFFTAR